MLGSSLVPYVENYLSHNLLFNVSITLPLATAFRKKGSRFPACLANSSYFSKPVACSTLSGIIWSADLTADRWTSLLDALHLAKLELTWYKERESRLAMILSENSNWFNFCLIHSWLRSGANFWSNSQNVCWPSWAPRAVSQVEERLTDTRDSLQRTSGRLYISTY